jgi:hypothetical protein
LFREQFQHRQRLRDRTLPHLAAADLAVAFAAVDEFAATQCGGKMHKSDRLCLRAAAWSGDARDGNREVGQ